MPFSHIPTPVPTLEQFVVDQLRDAILRGDLVPGQRLDQEELATLLGVSRSPVRIALRTLYAEGLVELLPHRGAMVAELSIEELEEIYHIRGILEGMIIRSAVPKCGAEELTYCRELLKEMEKPIERDRWVELNGEFHRTIYQKAGRRRLLSMIDSLRHASALYVHGYIATEDHLRSACASHRRILEAIEEGNPLRAQEETERHLQEVAKGVIGTLTPEK
jgi:DNA-binding GntR family transcriptional regulator